ncbi:AAA family ATPase [Amnibacterium sp. CER49]|uniref:AAA family ATPase n=1 Tax=Amnibacterium sp. CER49 TaxID=3039161 RepID=UPI0024468054|nr:AAA family ATPase [Amnibacterium sp. CER49]MDH2442432.1 AAA family ATPase [Amnibacterium sp. CER49]
MPAAPLRARRVLVAGPSGVGKTTLAAAVARAAGIPHTEIDAVHWHAGWTPNPDFAAHVQALADSDAWVTEWQYDVARPVLAARADLLVWLDLPRRVVLARVVRRTLRRRLRRLELWNGNVEPALATILTDPEHIVRWAMRTYGIYPGRVREALAEHPGVRLVRIRNGRDARRLLALLEAGADPGTRSGSSSL